MKQFTCKACGGRTLEEVITNVTVKTTIIDCCVKGGVLDKEYGDHSLDGGAVDHLWYQCHDCGKGVSVEDIKRLCT